MTDTRQEVDRLLESADKLLADGVEGDDEDLQALAADARELLESTQPAELLSAVGADVGSESDPASLVSALDDADTTTLATLRRLKVLAETNCGDADDSLAEFQALGDTVEQAESEAGGAEDEQSVDTVRSALNDAIDELNELASDDETATGSEAEGSGSNDDGQDWATTFSSGRVSTVPSTDRPEMKGRRLSTVQWKD